MIDIMALTPLQLERFIHLQGIVDRQANEAAKVRALRDYYSGDHPILLTKRQQEYLGALVEETEFTFAHNLVRAIVDTLRERLDVSGFTVNGSGAEDAELQDDAESSAELAAMFWQWWKSSRTDAAQITLYRRALRDGKAYVIVDWDAAQNRPKFIVHRVDAGEVQPGIMLHRDPEDADNVLHASRYFYTFDPLNPGATGKQRKTVYLPGEIRKYIQGEAGNWEPFQDVGDPTWPLPWVDSTGAPLGIPVIEFANPGGSEIEQIIGLQNALNKTWLDLIAAADTNGFPLLAIEYSGDGAFGAVQQDDADIEGSDEFRISPGRAIEVDNATVKRLDASNLQPMIETMWTIVQAISGVSRTPAYYLRPVGGGDVPSGEALKQLESGLVKRAQERQLTFGQAWEDAFTMAYRLAQTFGSDVPEVDPLMIQTVWTDANVRNELAQAQIGQMYQALGVPDNTIWQQVLGFTPTDIAGWKADKRRDEAVKIANVSEALRRAGLQAQRPTDTTQNGNQGGNNERTGNTVP